MTGVATGDTMRATRELTGESIH